MTNNNKTRRNVISLIAASTAAGITYLLSSESRNNDRPQPEGLPVDDGVVPNTPPGISTGGHSIVDVREYGAAADGVTDDSLALYRSIQAAGTGGIVRIPAGDMVVDKLDTMGAIRLTEAANNITITGINPTESRLLMRSGQSDQHALVHVLSESDGASPNINIRNITIDGNKFEHNGGPGHGVLSSSSGGHLTIENCIIQNTRNSGIRLTGHMSADIRRCVFRNCGNPEVTADHAVVPNQLSHQETTIEDCLFLNTAGSDIDVGTDTDADRQVCSINRCYSEGSPRLLKLDPTNAKTTVSNTKFVAGDGAVPSGGIVTNNDTAQCGALKLDNVYISDCDGPGIDLGSATNIDAGALSSLELNDVAIQNVDNQHTRSYDSVSASGIYAEGTEFVQCERISIHDVGSENMGDALWLNQGCWGKIETVRHAGTDSLGLTADVTVVRNAAGTNPLQPDVQNKSDLSSWLNTDT